MKNRLLWVFCVLCSLAAVAVSAFATTPQTSYDAVPAKKVTTGGGQGRSSPSTIRDKEVRPEEVFKYGKQEFSLIARDTGFFPSRLIVRKNIPVRLYLTSASSKSLCIVMEDFAIRRGVSNQTVEEIDFLPTRAGEYRFYCPVGEIQGKLVVRD